MGCLEIALFMKQGVERFSDGWGPMWRSFVLPIALIPLSFIALSYMQVDTPEIADKDFASIAGLFFGKWIFTSALGLAILIAFAKAYDRMDNVLKTITVGNWVGAFLSILFLPILFSLLSGESSWADMYQFDILHSIYSYVVAAFVLTFTMKIPWELAGFLTILGLAINETSLDAVLWIAQLL